MSEPVAGRDVPTHDLAGKVRQAGEEKYHRLLESLRDAFALVTMDGHLQEWNQVFCDLLGYPPEELPRLTYRDLTPQPWHTVEERIIRDQVLPCGHSQVYEKEYRRKDGRLVPVELRTHLLRDAAGHPCGMWAIVRDISARKALENALRESEERYRRFITTANEGISITDQDYRITYANQSLASMLGYASDELAGMLVSDLLPAEDRPAFAERIRQRRRGIRERHECRHLRKDGSSIWLLTSVTPVLDEQGEFQGSFAMFTDLTHRKQAEEKLLQTQEKLEHLVTQRTAALAAANDKIKQMSFELLRAEERERGRIAGELHDQIGQALLLAKMKADMLTATSDSAASRTQAGELAGLLGQTIEEVRTLTFQLRPPALGTAGVASALAWLCKSLHEDYRLQVDYVAPADPLPLSPEARFSLYQAVRELLLNVVKHAGVKKARLTLSSDGDRLTVLVADRGNGISSDDTRLQQAGDQGFGLYNVRQRVEQLSGEFRIASGPGQGTAATITIPLTWGLTQKENAR